VYTLTEMEQDPFSSFNFESSPEKNDTDSKNEKKSEKRKSFMDEIIDRRNSKQTERSSEKSLSKPETSSAEAEPTKKELAKEYLDHKADDLKNEIENHSSLEQAVEAQADLALVEAITEKIDDPDLEVEPAVEEAYAELMEAIEEVGSDLDTQEDPSSPEAEAKETDEEPTPVITAPISLITRSSGPTSTKSGGTPPPASPTSPPSSPPTRPPIPPIRPVGAVPAPPINPNFNTAPTTNPEEERRRVAGKMIVAGAVGYMIGRRGGRKRAEAKLMPEIKKRDESIVDLKKNVEQKEFQIRQVAKEQYKKDYFEKKSVKPEVTPKPTETHTEKTELPKFEFKEPAPNTVRSEAQKPTVFAETAEDPKADQVRHVYEAQLQLENEYRNKHIETVSTPDLLRIAEKIIVLDTTVKKLFETNQIDRHGLEEIIKEHLKGHDIGPVLDKRLLGKEAILDRSHEYRHDPSFGVSNQTDDNDTNASSDKSTPAHEQPAKPSNATPTLAETATPFSATSDEFSRQPTSGQGESSKQPKKQTATIAAIAVVSILLGLLIAYFIFSL
jgi:hypothetical protein